MLESKPTGESACTGRDAVIAALRRQRPPRLVYAPNYWQWFAHHRNHGTLPAEIAHCRSQVEVIRHLGLDVFSRNVYCDEQRDWFGGVTEEVFDDRVEVCVEERTEGRDRIIEKTYRTRRGLLNERRRYVFEGSNLVQETFAVSDPDAQLDALEELVRSRRWRFQPERYARAQHEVGDDGLVIAGELCSPLKMLHRLVGPANTAFLIADHPERTRELTAMHEAAQLDLVRQMAAAGVPAMMAMDNLDSAFHPPRQVERFCASFYEQASRICHEHEASFWIHACGRQSANLRLIDSLGVDGLEGVAFPPLGDVTLEEAMLMTKDRFLITGGISAFQTMELQTRKQVLAYVQDLFERMRPWAHRFMFSASCSTAIDARWETLVQFRDAWWEFGGLE